MNEMQAKESIQYIKEMIERTKRITAGSWMFFLVWGIIGILGVIGMYVLVYFEQYSWIWINWVFFVTIGIVYLMFIGEKERTREMKTFAQIAVRYLCFACGIAFLFVGFIFPLFGLYSWGLIAVLISLVAGILVESFKVVRCYMVAWSIRNGFYPRVLPSYSFHTSHSHRLYHACVGSSFNVSERKKRRCLLRNFPNWIQ